ncbi:MAG: hypothetical protein ABJL57_11855 [Hyphomonas sp.]|uniref:hypothetical protein n=1 Tax=Hyphomonas sp. TaxID=87 RepID=UPI003267CB58|tara:strand:+ start:136 stop:486 length:351 start_codon:yes stop_codon:yes gene_type:complete
MADILQQFRILGCEAEHIKAFSEYAATLRRPNVETMEIAKRLVAHRDDPDAVAAMALYLTRHPSPPIQLHHMLYGFAGQSGETIWNAFADTYLFAAQHLAFSIARLWNKAIDRRCA